MSRRQLSALVIGIASVCLASLSVPIDAVERAVTLSTVGFGIAFAALFPGFDHLAPRVAGPAVIVLAVAPLSMPWTALGLGALFVVGFSCFEPAGLARVVPALGLPIATAALRTGSMPDPPFLLAWLAATVVTVVLCAHAWPIEAGPALAPLGASAGDDGPRPVLFRPVRSVQALVAVAVLVPASVELAAVVDERLPAAVPLAQQGALDGPPLAPHPGLDGGLDAGQPISLSEEIVLRVDTDRPLYWRGTTYDQWDGRRWTSGAVSRPISWTGGGVTLPDVDDGVAPGEAAGIDGVEPDPELPAPVTVRQTFRLARAGLDVLPAAWRPVAVWTSAQDADLTDDGAIRLREPLGAGATWTVESEVVPATDDDLRRADPVGIDPDSALMRRYATEDAVPPAVAALAAELTAEAPTTLDKIRAIEEWMDDNLTYSREIATLDEGRDAVETLLFESKRGYCEQIGSALVVMLRSLGIPARLVVGFVPSEQDPLTGEWISRGSDAHAWAEVFFPGVGWRGFDPTAGVPPAPTGPPETERPTGPLLVAGGVLGGVAIGTAIAVVLRRVRRRGDRHRRDELADAIVARELLAAFDRAGRKVGLTWDETATVRRRGSDLVAAGVDSEPVTDAVNALEELWFRRAGVGPDDTGLATARRALAELDRAVTRRVQTGSEDRPVSEAGSSVRVGST